MCLGTSWTNAATVKLLSIWTRSSNSEPPPLPVPLLPPLQALCSLLMPPWQLLWCLFECICCLLCCWHSRQYQSVLMNVQVRWGGSRLGIYRGLPRGASPSSRLCNTQHNRIISLQPAQLQASLHHNILVLCSFYNRNICTHSLEQVARSRSKGGRAPLGDRDCV